MNPARHPKVAFGRLGAMACLLALLALALPAAPAHADDMPGMGGGGGAQPVGNLELFLALRTHDGSRVRAPDDVEEDDWALGDLVFSAEHGRLRMMGEYNLSTVEHDFERLQFGIEPVPDTLLWVGRFHQPGSAWNNEFHHGPYLQTAISRPSVELWEDEEGLVPQHLLGVLVESRWPVGHGAGLRAQLGVGYGSNIDKDGLDPISVVDHNRGGHHPSVTGQFAWLPTYLGQSSAGLLFGTHRSGVVDPGMRLKLGTDEVGQGVVGAYGHYVGERLRVLGVAYHVAAELRGNAAPDVRESFWAGYVQAEWSLATRYTVYARLENAPGAGGNRLSGSYADDLVMHGLFAGLRWDFMRRNALTLEASRATLAEGPANRILLQWSAAFP